MHWFLYTFPMSCWRRKYVSVSLLLNQDQQPQQQPRLDEAVHLHSAGRDKYVSAAPRPPGVFRAHPGGSEGNGGARGLLQIPVIIYWAWASVGSGQW